MKPQQWHALEVEDVAAILRTDPDTGLSEREAARRLRKHGPNLLVEQKRPSPVLIFLNQFRDFMVMVLLAATLISALLGEIGDAVTIIAIVIMNAILGFWQECRAERSMEALRKLTAPTAKACREGKRKEIAAESLVPGDVVYIETGDRIPADVRLFDVVGLEVDESALTGESQPVAKATSPCEPGVAIADRHNMAYMGTSVTRGRGMGIVVSTGMSTEMGIVAGMIQESVEEATPLQKRLAQLGKYLVYGCLLVSFTVTATGILRGEPVYRMFLAGVSLAVAAIPEGLPAIVTIGLAVGVQRMIRANAIIRRLPAVETLGCATVICSDKTGTLTKNEMTVRVVYVNGQEYQVEGRGYEPKGKFLLSSSEVDAEREQHLRKALLAACLCNNAVLKSASTEDETRRGLLSYVKKALVGRVQDWNIQGDPTEGALLVAAAKAGLWKKELEQSCPRLGEIPFEPERRCMSVVVRDPTEGVCLYTKGAPDTVLKSCTKAFWNNKLIPIAPGQVQQILRVNDRLAAQALRVLAVAYKPLPHLPQRYTPQDLERDMVFLGLIGMMDPPRPEAKAAVDKCHRAGIKTVMITGDHANTAAAIATELGMLTEGGLVVTEEQLHQMSDRQLARVADDIYVYARVSPKDKLRIVRALKQRGHIVAMTGDGVNDAPAVKEADIGVAMGVTGTDVTREASDMVLADDNFATIVSAVEEGRAIYDNIRKFIRYLLSCNVGEVLVMFLAAVMGLPLPLVPIQMLWVNLVTDGLPAMALGVDPAEPDIMDRPPRPPGESVFARRLMRKIIGRGTLIGLSTLAVFMWGLWTASDNLIRARTLAFATLVMSQLFHVFDCRSERRSIYEMGVFTNPYLVGAVTVSTAMLVGVIYVPSLQPLFETWPINGPDWAVVLTASGLGAILVGLRRLFLYRFKLPRAHRSRLKKNKGKL